MSQSQPQSKSSPLSPLDAVPHAIAVLDSGGKVAFVNAAWRSTCADTLLVAREGQDFCDAFSGDGNADRVSASNIVSAVRQVLDGVQNTSSAQHRVRANGKVMWFQVVVRRRTDARAGAIVMFEDRTAMRAHYTEAVEANRILRDVLDHLPRRAFWKDVDGRILGGNTTFLTDFDAHSLIGKSIDEVPWPRAMADFFRVTDAEVVATGQSKQGLIEIEAVAGDPERWIDAASAPLKRGDGSVIGTIGSYVDVTEEHALRKAVRASDERLRLTLEAANKRLSDFVATASDWLWECDGDKAVTQVSERFFERSGYERAALIGKRLSAFTPSEVHQSRESPEARRIQESKDFRDIFLQFPLKDGTLMYVRISGKAQHDQNGVFTGYLGTASDVTDAVRQGNAAKQAQKLQAVGTLAAGVAHEFNNILAIIRGYADLTKRALQRGDTSAEDIDQVIEAAARGSTLTKGLLAFGRKSAPDEISTFDLAELVDEQRLFLRPLTGPRFQLTVVRKAQDTFIRARRDGVAQALMNLVLNARDASPDGGRADMSVDVAVAADVKSRFGAPPTEGRFVSVSVTDTGTGMNDGVLRRIFEPFFTTKEVGKGTGLGLHFVYQLIAGCGGYLNVTSEVGQGTTFQLYFPQAEPVEVKVAADGAALVHHKGRTALVVDDEPALAAIYKAMLEDIGFAATVSSDPEEALEIVDNWPGDLHLIVSDVLMPKLDGPRFTELATALHPEARVLFVTGQPDRGAQAGSSLPAGAPMLRKPFTRDELAAELAALLDNAVTRKTA